PHPRVEAARGCLAIERGPLVYCLEDADQASASVLDLLLDADGEAAEQWEPDVLGGVVSLRMRGAVVDSETWGDSTFRPKQSEQTAGTPVDLKAVPYYAWA